MIFTSFDEHGHATPRCVCAACQWQIQCDGLAIVLVVDDGRPLVSTTFCVNATCELAFTTTNPPTRGAQWRTFPLGRFLATLLKNSTALEGAAADRTSGH